jgi:acyl-[acyl-carrier-protein]-phospholipid O-acyltransferase/long-chain-fatty-acid--[acyl-carrier-protein] ligase
MGEPGTATERRGSFRGPFGWVVAAHGLSSLAFFAFYGVVFVQAAYDHDAGPGQTAILGIALSIPFILGSLLQGIVVDRWSPKWMATLGYAGVACAVATAWAGNSLAALYASAFLVGISFAAIEPARSSLTGLLVPPEGLVRANSVMAISFQVALAVGSLGGGAILDVADAKVVYAAAFVAAVLPVLCMLFVPDRRPEPAEAEPSNPLVELITGARTAWNDRWLRLLLVVTGVGWAFVNTFFVLEPIYVRTVLQQREAALLFLWGAHGLAAVITASVLAARGRRIRREPLVICAGVVLIGTGIFVYTAPASYPLAFVGAALQGAGFSLMYPPLLAFIQRAVAEDQRGRVTSVFVAMQEAMGLVSSLVILALGNVVPVQATLVAGGAALAALGAAGMRLARATPATEAAVDATAA